MSSNAELKQLIKDMNEKSEVINNHHDVMAIVKMAVDYDGKFEFEHGEKLKILALCVVVVIALLIYSQTVYRLPDIWYYSMILTGGLGVAVLAVMASQKGSIKQLSAKLYQADLKFDNGIQPIRLTDEEKNQFKKEFIEFSRGNYSRKFTRFFSIKPVDDVSRGLYYQYHYVDKRIETVTESDGKGGVKTRQKTVYYHYDRYGVIFDFEYGHGLSINSNGSTRNPVLYKPAYMDFNNKFEIGANSELDAAKYLKPALQESLVTHAKSFSGLNIQISEQGQLLIAFDQPLYEGLKSTNTLRNPQEFYNELAEDNNIERLQKINEIYHLLTKHLDNNFK